ncbi:MAG TPA: hypothetical protein VN151_08340 [Terracidiphilus sp.]|nr:hypothetical protein [Terracidiphilus sp.]
MTLSGCTANSSSSGSTASQGQGTVNLVVSDTPPANITVLSFRITITGAVLQPGNVSLLPRPVTVDLAQLVSDTGFLASTVIDSGTFTSLTMTYANPQVTIQNNRTTSITVAGTTCAPGAICTLSPALNQASVTVSNTVFPLTVAANSTTGLALDLSIPDLLQSDLSITLASGTSVNLSLLSSKTAASQQVEIDDVFATIKSISGNSVTVQTALGAELILTSGSSTVYNYPASICASAGASCLAAGQVVKTNLSLLGEGALALNTITYIGGSGASFAEGLVLSTDNTSSTPTMQVLVQRVENTSSLTPGQIATVVVPSSAAFSVASATYPAVNSASFATSADLIAGQEVILAVGSDLVSGDTPNFTTNTLYLESSQTIGRVVSVDTTNQLVVINGLSGLYTGQAPIIQQMDVQAGTSTSYIGFSSSNLNGLAAGQFVAAKGPLFNTTASSSQPTISATELRKRIAGN